MLSRNSFSAEIRSVPREETRRQKTYAGPFEHPSEQNPEQIPEALFRLGPKCSSRFAVTSTVAAVPVGPHLVNLSKVDFRFQAVRILGWRRATKGTV
jgi:hypothetical protein